MKPGPNPPTLILRNDVIVPQSDPVVRLDDAAMVQGHGLFETLRIYRGVPFALKEHLERMTQGCNRLGLRAPSLSNATGSIDHLLEANELPDEHDYRLRITITDGANGQLTFYQLSPCPVHSETATMITGPNFVRNERGLLSGIKTLSYGENAVACRMTRGHNVTEALWSNTRDELCEGTWSNVFVRIDNGWKTPPLSSGCLAGVTRQFVLSIASRSSLEIDESPILLSELSQVDAAFLTSSIREIQPVTAIDGRPMDLSSAPEIAMLQERFETFVRRAFHER